MTRIIKCIICKEIKENHAKGMCKTCYSKKNYKKNRKNILKNRKQYYKDNREEQREKHNQYYKDHREERKQYREDRREETKQYREINIRTKVIFSNTSELITTQIFCTYNINTQSIGIYTKFSKSHGCHNGAENNKNCALWLGNKAENMLMCILMNMFNSVKKMPPKNPGFDFLCEKGCKIDAKSSCLNNNNSWSFHINRNKTADFFLCLAFDDRENLTPLHVWLIPGYDVNHLTGLTITKTRLSKWSKYEESLDKILMYCEKHKNPND